MEKMEHMDPQRCDRIWQRVSPELDPYPEVRAACRDKDTFLEVGAVSRVASR